MWWYVAYYLRDAATSPHISTHRTSFSMQQIGDEVWFVRKDGVQDEGVVTGPGAGTDQCLCRAALQGEILARHHGATKHPGPPVCRPDSTAVPLSPPCPAREPVCATRAAAYSTIGPARRYAMFRHIHRMCVEEQHVDVAVGHGQQQQQRAVKVILTNAEMDVFMEKYGAFGGRRGGGCGSVDFI